VEVRVTADRAMREGIEERISFRQDNSRRLLAQHLLMFISLR